MVQAYATEYDVPRLVADAWSRAMESEPCMFDDDAHEMKCRNQVIDLVTTYLSEVSIAGNSNAATARPGRHKKMAVGRRH